MFWAIFAHDQERETEIFTAYGNLQRWIYRKLCRFFLYITIFAGYQCCKNLSLTLLIMGKYCPKHVELIL